MKEIMRIHVILDSLEEVHGHRGSVVFIPFHGTAEGPCFNGSVLPGGVDTQIQPEGMQKTLSARYILEGTDSSGTPCRIFIENNGTVPVSGTLHTVPRIITDSKELAWLEDAKLSGTVSPENEGVLISLFVS